MLSITDEASPRLSEKIKDAEEILSRTVGFIMEDFGIPESLEVNVLIVGEEEIRQINKEMRGIDSPTDVLSFPYFDFEAPLGNAPGHASFSELPSANEELIFGDIVLCLPKILSQAEEYGHSPQRELAFLCCHSMLHLSGYDHIDDEDRKKMQAQEKRIMESLGISR